MFSDLTQLQRIERDCWELLRNAVTDRDCGWRLPALATWSGTSLHQRTVVLRGVDELSQILFFHTDIRSPKVSDIRNHSHVSLVFYDHLRSVQIRVAGEAAIHTDDVISSAIWSAGEPENLKMYLAPEPPGTRSESSSPNLPDEFLAAIPDRAALEAGRKNFCVISVAVRSIDWLLLRRIGHLRAEFRYNDDEDSHRSWLCP